MSTIARFLLIILLTGTGPAFAMDAGSMDSSRASSTIDHTPPGTLNPEPLPPLANPHAPSSQPHHLSQAAALHWSDITCWPRKKQETRLRFRPKARITPWGFLLLDDYQSLALSVQLGARLWGFPG